MRSNRCFHPWARPGAPGAPGLPGALAFSGGLSAILLLLISASLQAQPGPDAPFPARGIRIIGEVPAQVRPADPAKPADTATDQPATDTDTAKPAQEPVDPKVIRLHLSDGSIISGKLTIDALPVDTRFGRLTIPIEEIRFVRPGLESRPAEMEKVTALLENLGSANVTERQAAATELAKYGPIVRDQLQALAADQPQGPRAAEIRTLLERINEKMESEGLDADDFSSQDIIATTKFTIAGRIVPQSFQLESDFGNLTMSLADMLKADRNTGEPEEERKTVTVAQENFVTRTMKSTGLRVTKGDKITIRATGQITMTRWGNAVATPEGAANTGWYVNNQIYNGALCMRIGSGGTISKVGNSITVTAPASGVLHLGIAMNPRYAADSFQYPGQFKADVRIQRK